MNWTDYKDQVKADALESIEENFEHYEDWDEMYEALFIDDSVTGNGSGSYTFCTAKAAENVAGIIFDDEAIEVFNDAGYNGIPTEKGAEACDVIARCLALDYVLADLEDQHNELRNAESVENDGYAYKIIDTHEAPQCGADEVYLIDWKSVERYLELNPDVKSRIDDGYAVIREID